MLAETARKTLTPIGIDAGTEGFRAVQMRCDNGKYTVASVLAQDWTNDDGRSLAWRERASFLQSVLGGGFRGRQAVLALSDADVDYFSLDLPGAVIDSQAREVADVVQWEVARLMREDGATVETRHWLLPSARPTAPNAMGAAVRQDVVTEVLAACRIAGLQCETVDAGAAALARFGLVMRPPAKQEVWGILDLGGSRTRLIVCLEDVPVLVRAAGAGGRAWTDRIAEAIPLSRHAAELQKCEHGIALASGSRGEHDERPTRHEIASIVLGAIRADLHGIAAEVKRSYEYVLSCYPGCRVGELMLVGGGAAMPNLPKFLAGALGIPVRESSLYLGETSCRLAFASGKRHRVEQVASSIGAAIAE